MHARTSMLIGHDCAPGLSRPTCPRNVGAHRNDAATDEQRLVQSVSDCCARTQALLSTQLWTTLAHAPLQAHTTYHV